MTVPAKGRWMLQDLARHARRYGVPFVMNPHFPINTLALMRVATGIQLREPARLGDYLEAVFGAIWRRGLNLGDPAVLAGVLVEAGFDAAALAAQAADPEVKARLQATTEEAIERGVFGAPSFFVGDEMFFGQDRLEQVREALQR